MANSWITFITKWKGAVKTTGKGKDVELDDTTKKGGKRKGARKAYTRGKADKKDMEKE